MKKTYIIPELTVQHIETQFIIALSIVDGDADDSEVLVKGNNSDIWGDRAQGNYNVWDDDWNE